MVKKKESPLFPKFEDKLRTMDQNKPPVCESCLVRDHSPLRYCPLDDLEKIETNKTVTYYKKGQVVFHEGSYPKGIYCISSGKVKIYKTGAQGVDQIVRLAKTGDWLGYRAILGQDTFAASAATLEDSSICFLAKEEFLRLLSSNAYISSCVTKLLAEELRFAEKRELSLSQKSVRERLAETLLLLKETYGFKNGQTSALNVNLSREELANFVGTATETLIRLLSDFKEEKLISTEGHSIHILNIPELVKVANIYD